MRQEALQSNQPWKTQSEEEREGAEAYILQLNRKGWMTEEAPQELFQQLETEQSRSRINHR